MNNKSIAHYYDCTLPWYKIFYHWDSYGLHHGYHDNTTNNHLDEVINTNRVLAETARISSDDYILDAGCGVGGSAVWLAKNYKAKIVGISLSQKQIDQANNLAAKFRVSNLVQFYNMDYTRTSFKNDTFDVVWAIESVCHAKNKIDFLREAYRILQKGGRLVVADGFLSRQPNSKEEKDLMRLFYKGFFLDNIATVDSFNSDMKRVGFKNIQYWNKTKEAMPSIEWVHNISKCGRPFALLLSKIGMISPIIYDNAITGIAEYDAIKKGLGGHFLFYGEK